MVVAFAGHSFIASPNEVKAQVKNALRHFFSTATAISCYLGGRGAFDELCAGACKELKEEYPNIELVYVMPYLSIAEQEKFKQQKAYGTYDSTVYPPIESTPPKFAILKRNKWMMANADVVIAFVNRRYGGAYQALQVAIRKKKQVVNLCDLP